MKTFERVLFLIGFLIISIYTTRHIYQLWLAPRTSVLDPYKAEAENAVGSAGELQELLAKYRPVHEAVRKIEQQNQGKPEEQWRFESQEPFSTEATLRRAIEEWEGKQRELFEMRVYWAFGLLTGIAGLVIHRKASRWLGLAFVITGFSEMIYWCSPAWFSQATAETDRLLGYKLALSMITMMLLVVGGRVLGLLRNDDARDLATAPDTPPR